MTQTGIEPATFRFLAQHLSHCATAVPRIMCTAVYYPYWKQYVVEKYLVLDDAILREPGCLSSVTPGPTRIISSQQSPSKSCKIKHPVCDIAAFRRGVDEVFDVLNRADRLSRNVGKNCQHMMRNAPEDCRTNPSITPPAVKPSW